MSTNDQRSRYVLVITLPRDVEIRIEDRFLGLSGATKPLMGYHITLLGSFLLPEDVDPLSLTEIGQACATIEPFEIAISGTGAFERPDNHTIYIAVVEAAPIKALQRALWQALEPLMVFANDATRAWNLPDSFHPHVTLGMRLSDAEYQAFQGAVNDQPCAADFRVTQIDLMAQNADGPWQKLAHYPLGSHPSMELDKLGY